MTFSIGEKFGVGKKVSTIAMLGPLLAMPSGQGLNMTLLAILKVNRAGVAEKCFYYWQDITIGQTTLGTELEWCTTDWWKYNPGNPSCIFLCLYMFTTMVYIYMSHRKNLGNTKYVLDGHWFMEMDGNC